MMMTLGPVDVSSRDKALRFLSPCRPDLSSTSSDIEAETNFLQKRFFPVLTISTRIVRDLIAHDL